MAHIFSQDLILAKLSGNNWYNLFSLSRQCAFFHSQENVGAIEKKIIGETAVITCVISDCRNHAVFDRLLVTARVWDIVTFCKIGFAVLSCVQEGFSVLFNQSTSFYFYNAIIGYHALLDAEN